MIKSSPLIIAYLEGPQVEGVLGEHPPALPRVSLLHQWAERAMRGLDRVVFLAAHHARRVAAQEGVEPVVVAPAAAVHEHLAPGQDKSSCLLNVDMLKVAC